jgi:hypothetical protein
MVDRRVLKGTGKKKARLTNSQRALNHSGELSQVGHRFRNLPAEQTTKVCPTVHRKALGPERRPVKCVAVGFVGG